MPGTSPGMTSFVVKPYSILRFEPDSRPYSNPALRAHLYFAPSTATGISVE